MLRCGVAGLALLVAISTPECDARGTVETKPTSDEDWARVRRATVLPAESTNLLKMPRRVAPEGEKNELSGPGKPELAPEPIQAKLDQDRHRGTRTSTSCVTSCSKCSRL